MSTRYVMTSRPNLQLQLLIQPEESEETPEEETTDQTSGSDDSEDAEGNDEQGGDEEGGDDEDEDEEEDEDDEDEDEEELVDPLDTLREECTKSKHCQPYVHHYEECVERVTKAQEQEGYEHQAYKEDCVEEYFHLQHCVNDCVAPKLFYKLK
ncbi:Cytochrome b-c1 complex subunit 6 [Meyerozyma sp. JA9]|nr:Cytochrome b-c1 complex subunit 6 [Meyerozyma sp. JA9]